MTKNNCHQYAKKFSRYSYNDEYCIRNNFECTFNDEPVCGDIGCEDQPGDSCMTIAVCENNTNESNRNSTNEEIRKGNDYVTKFQGQPLCKETGCAVIKEGRCKSTKICRKNTKDFPGYYCIDDYCNYDDCVYMYIEELSTDIRDADQKEGRRMITEECSIKMTEST